MKNKEYDVTALGELLIDFTDKGISESGNPVLEANPGGAPCNVLAMLQKLGRKTLFIGKVGDDHFGHLLADTIKEVGIDTGGLVYDPDVHTTLAFVHRKADGDRDFSFYRNPGADMMLSEQDVDEGLIASSKLFHFGTLSMTSECGEAATKKAIGIARERGLVISFDPNIRKPLWSSPDLARQKMEYGLSCCDILKISDDEILFFTGESDIDKGIRMIRERFNIALVCATLGKVGSIAYYGDETVRCPSTPNPNAVDTTGAGDTFMGCIIDSCLDHMKEEGAENRLDLSRQTIMEMLQRANNAASKITERYGALKVMPSI
ncbi:carbohydrate kinase family protein [Butyrivibrio sp. YAB3001]|uniref:carbohydrate kinase family protein n=1 Tax=Butyrivibrio sp. YAB3001 TaxID=1520812 RepID=UPI0008F6812E|nr:carbohydrate kinase [Butyrivibrio sp. YAB3001]SFC71004.1 fructokinase [Butyrivibrio sp. YAB3001]